MRFMGSIVSWIYSYIFTFYILRFSFKHAYTIPKFPSLNSCVLMLMYLFSSEKIQFHFYITLLFFFYCRRHAPITCSYIILLRHNVSRIISTVCSSHRNGCFSTFRKSKVTRYVMSFYFLLLYKYNEQKKKKKVAMMIVING